MNKMDQLTNSLISFFEHLLYNNYSFLVDRSDALSRSYVILIKKLERLNEPWQYQIDFTSENKQISIGSILSQVTLLSFHLTPLMLQITQISSYDHISKSRKFYGIIKKFSLVPFSEDEFRYQVKFEHQIALFANHHLNTITIVCPNCSYSLLKK